MRDPGACTDPRALQLPHHWTRHRGRRRVLLLRPLCRSAGRPRRARPRDAGKGADERMSTKIKDIMSRDLHYVNPDDTLQDAAKQMRSHDVGFLPVVEGQSLVGAVTDRDIAIKAVAEGKDPKKTKVKDLASKDVAWCYDDQDPDDAAKVM